MELNPTGTAAVQAPAVAAAEDKRTALTSDYEMFLKMLTAQMTNQDPLNPVDSSDYAVQLATFSSVEQQVLTNDLLTELTAQLGSNSLSDMASYVGRDVRTQSPAYFDGTPIDLYADMPSGADAARLTVRSENGNTIQEFDLSPDVERLTWAGLDDRGNPVPSGLYSFEVTSYSSGEVLEQDIAETYSRIVEARSGTSGLELVLSGGVAARPADVTAMREVSQQ